MVGRTIAQYEILAKRGGGGMGIVYTARDTRLGRLVALKFLPPEWSHDETAKQRFIREAQAASATDHRNICTIHDIATAEDGQLFIVMAHYDGQTLKERLEAGPLPVDEAIDVAAQIAEGLAKAHAQGIVHRDVKPGNVMLTEDGVKILDFGLAKFADSSQLTIVGSTLGTVAYMSPEQTRAQETDARSDVWAVGVVLYQMLAGAVPFKGGYIEAVAHAIRTEPPPPIARADAEIPEPLSRIVDRALQKDPAERYQTARELARDLRLLQGRTLPVDLRTEYVTTSGVPPIAFRRRWWTRRPIVATAVVLAVASIIVPIWLLSPIDRVPIAIVPVINQTGYAELDSYRMAMTAIVVSNLTASPAARVVPYQRLLQVVRRYRVPGNDVSSREAIQALTASSGARIVVVPVLLFDNGGWRARVEFRDATTGTNLAVHETAALASSIAKDAAYALVPQIASAVEHQADLSISRRAYAAARARALFGRGATASDAPAFRTLDAAAAFEQGIDAYEQQEYGTALAAFARAGDLDPQAPLAEAWRSRVARLMRHDNEAAEAARRAEQLLISSTPAVDALFVRAAVSEARRDFAAAEAAYRTLARRYPDDATWTLEIAGLLDREARTSDAVEAYYVALKTDPRLARPHLELCRLYGPAKLNDAPKARREGETAIAAYRALGGRAGEAQTLWCLADALNDGTEQQRAESRRDAEQALTIFKDLGYPYNLSRAYAYIALAAAAQGRFTDAVSASKAALENAKSAGNVGLEPAVLTNLAVLYRNLGDAAQALASLKDGYRIFETLGDQQRAAQNRANAASLLIEYGGDLDEALRDVQNASAVANRLEDRRLQVFCLEVLAAYYRTIGRAGDADRELNRALALAGANNLPGEATRITIERARVRIDVAEYEAARALLATATTDRSLDAAIARIYLGMADSRLGALDAAARTLDEAAADLDQPGGAELSALLHTTRGELELQRSNSATAIEHFRKSAVQEWTALVSDAAIEGRAYTIFLPAISGRNVDRGLTTLREILMRVGPMHRPALDARCRLLLAQLQLRANAPADAITTLDGIPTDGRPQAISPELVAQTHYWRSRALAARGDRAAAQMAAEQARRIVSTIAAALPETTRQTFLDRPDVRPMTQ